MASPRSSTGDLFGDGLSDIYGDLGGVDGNGVTLFGNYTCDGETAPVTGLPVDGASVATRNVAAAPDLLMRVTTDGRTGAATPSSRRTLAEWVYDPLSAELGQLSKRGPGMNPLMHD